MGARGRLFIACALLCTSLPALLGFRLLQDTTTNGGSVSAYPQVGGAVSSGYEAPIGTWRRARTSWYGTPDWVKPYAATRGGGIDAFGILPWGGCGYTNGNGDIQFSQEEAAAYSDDNPDWPGTCGRCYEVRCVPGPVVGPNDVPIGLEHLYYYPKFLNQSDEMGRAFPGNPAVGDNYQIVTCWDQQKTTVVKIVDLCPCYYCPSGQECRYQESCCYKRINHPKAGQISLDVSFWAFQKLAHPAYGIMMVDYRPVDCYTHQPLQYIPGHISKNLYSEMVGEGWAWFSYKTAGGHGNNFNVSVKGLGVGGSAAACAEVAEQGAQTFWARGAGLPAFQPFMGVSTLSFSIKDLANPGQIPPVRIVLSGDYSLPTNAAPGTLPPPMPNQFCNSEVYIQGRANTPLADGYLRFDIPISDFGCPIEKMNKIDFMATSHTTFCLDDVRLVPGQEGAVVYTAPSPAVATAAAAALESLPPPPPADAQMVPTASSAIGQDFIVTAQSGDTNHASTITDMTNKQGTKSDAGTPTDIKQPDAAQGHQSGIYTSANATHTAEPGAADGGKAVESAPANAAHTAEPDAAE